MSHLAELVASATAAINQASDVAALDNVRVEYLGKKGHLTLQMTTLRELPPEERPAAGAVINEAKEQVQQALNARKAELESAVLNAVANPRDIDSNLVNAQQARSALDYLVGFNLSPLLWRKVRQGLSAGRVQSPALRLIFEAGRNNKRELEFEHFKTTAGPDLDSFATWCLCFEVWGAPWGENRWFFEKTIDDPAVRQLVEEHHDLFEFNRWLQWIAAEQVNAAQQEALDHGMTLGLMQDMAVGVHGLGADAWANPERFASGGVTVGCPPDFYNQQGQDWGQPPFNPRYLEATGYQVYREMVHSMYEHAGAVRIDHVLGLFRLWWIPQGLGARNGAYVTYNHEAMLGVLAIEATRAGGMVVGEDLGTVPDYVRRILADHGVLGTDVEWFNRVDDSPNAGDPYRAPKDYRKQALASVTTHDLPPTAGYLNFAHVKLREELHLLSEPVEAFAASAMAERTAMMNRLVENGYISQTVADDVEGHVQEIVEAMHAMLTDTPSLLLQAALVDGVGECRSQNQPGTSREYSNWRVPLADSSGHVVHTDEVFDLPRVQSLAAVMRREKR